MTQYWNVDDITYHVSIDEKKQTATIEKHDADGEKVGNPVKVPLKDYDVCVGRYDVDMLFKSKQK